MTFSLFSFRVAKRVGSAVTDETSFVGYLISNIVVYGLEEEEEDFLFFVSFLPWLAQADVQSKAKKVLGIGQICWVGLGLSVYNSSTNFLNSLKNTFEYRKSNYFLC